MPIPPSRPAHPQRQTTRMLAARGCRALQRHSQGVGQITVRGLDLTPTSSRVPLPWQVRVLAKRTEGSPVTQHADVGAVPIEPDRNVTACRVLVAEDEALIRLDLVEILTEEGYAVVGEAADGLQAVEQAERLHPVLVIMDVKMPKMDGIDAASIIAERRIAPVVILTAFSQRELVERARDAGAMAYLVKPFGRKDLVPAVELAVSRFRELIALESEVAGLTDRLETRKVVERAKGLLMARHGLTEPEAFRWIQRNAMDRRTPMKAVAQAVIESLS